MAISFKSIYKDLLKKNINVDRLIDWQADCLDYARKVENNDKINIDELKAFIKICLNYYVYSSEGKDLIPDYTYDMCVNKYYQITGIDRTKDKLFLADDLLSGSKKWNFVDHPSTCQGLVGTIGDKLYSYQEIKDRFSYYNCKEYKIAPKYDGISVAIHKENGIITYAATRYDGYQGQDIRDLVKRAKFPKWWKYAPDGYYKNEILMSTDDYNELINEKYYANRRSAVSGIVNTPSNLQFAKYLTIMPLLYYNDKEREIQYVAGGIESINVYSARDLMDAIEKKLSIIRSADFPYRVDGVVVYPQYNHPINEGNLMDNTFAYKVNTNEPKTTIEYAYASVGRLGSVTPMVHVKPVEVNETMVSDVSLGSYAKFLSMNLRENEEVIVYSAGDVIPQIKLPDVRTNWMNDPDLKISKYCPYCGERFERIGTEYKCINPHCIRVMSGMISNFFIKLGIDGFSDKSFEILCKAKVINSIPDVFELTPEKIMSIDGFDQVSARNFYNEIQRIKNDKIQISEFFGALGIEGISVKKCRKILAEIDINKFLRKLAEDKGKNKAQIAMRCADGIGTKTATTFIAYVAKNLDMINHLLKIMNISGDTAFIGEVCFTGFRNSRWEEKFNSIGYKIGDSVNNNTTCLIAASIDSGSTKAKAAIRKGIPIFSYSDIEEVYHRLKDGIPLDGYVQD